MDIVSRLKTFLDQTGISNSQFADTCEIPRPTLSQLLNGRNKKVSDEVIGKIHRAYPTLNVMWLMFGDGEMLMNGNGTSGDADKMSPASSDSHPSSEEPSQRAISFDDDYPQVSRASQRVATPSTVNEAIQSIMRSNAVGRGTRGASSPEGRYVVNIMVFYSDGRFEKFEPSRMTRADK
ncbi:MAG: helix-turn-helix domain-containing protein [Muribaculaceae bacterium]|nr:helix-turn-helix domain-containing protein [Muribaculaceae bacterium]